MSDEYPPLKQPTVWEKIIIAATMILAAIFFPIADRLEGKQKR